MITKILNNPQSKKFLNDYENGVDNLAIYMNHKGISKFLETTVHIV